MSDRVERSGAAGVVPSHQALILTSEAANQVSRFPVWSNLASYISKLSPATKALLGVLGVPLATSLIGLGVLFTHNRIAHIKSRQEPSPRDVKSEHREALSVIVQQVPDVVTNEDGSVNYGIYRGRIANANVEGHNLPFPFWGKLAKFRSKKWQFHSVETEELYMTMAILHAGYATKIVALAYDKNEGVAWALDETAPLSLGLVDFGVSSIDSTHTTAYSYGENSLSFKYKDNIAWHITGTLKLKEIGGEGRSRRTSLDLHLTDAVGSIDQLALVFPYTSMSPAYTHKAMCLPTSGTLAIGEKSFKLWGSQGALDWSIAFSPYLTQWKWLFVSGKTVEGNNFGINFSSADHYGESENAIWIDGNMSLAGPISFIIPYDHVLEQQDDKSVWIIESSEPGSVPTSVPSPTTVNLTFAPIFKKFVPMSTGVVDSKYVQLLGHIKGTIKIGSTTHTIESTFGIAERQLCMW